MFKLIALFSALCAVASAGLISPYAHSYGGLGYSAIAAPAYHSSAIVSHAPIIKSYAAPVVAAPIIKSYAPIATSYANTYKVATKAIPVVHAAPALVHAPVAVAAPALHTTSTYHGLGYSGLGYGHAGLAYGHAGLGYGHAGLLH